MTRLQKTLLTATEIAMHLYWLLTSVSLALMFCAGLMATSFWAIRADFHPFWWTATLWMMLLSTWAFFALWRTAV